MKKTLIEKIPYSLPDGVARFIENSRIFDSSCSPEARVYFIEKDAGYYLKINALGELKKEAELTDYFNSIGLGAKVLFYHSLNGKDLLLSSAVKGEDCTHSKYLNNPKRLCDTIAERLRLLHETDFKLCPVQNRMKDYLALADKNYATGNYDKSAFPDSFGYKNPEEAYAVLNDGRGGFKNEVLLHGDYCLPNIILDDWRFSGFIDLGNGGVGDRHIDIFWGIWTLWFNLKTNKYAERFLDAYGRDKVDVSLIKTVAAAEVFG